MSSAEQNAEATDEETLGETSEQGSAVGRETTVSEKSFSHLVLDFASSYLSCSMVFSSSSRRCLFPVG